MIFVISLIVLVINAYASGEGWHRMVIRSFSAVCLLAAAAYTFPGQIMMLMMTGLSALTARELYILDERRQRAERRLDRLCRPVFRITAKLSKSSKGDGHIAA
ncbi:MAG: hypothetical protein IJ129_06120 [Ruminococcus sp.]|nr:hypothetical protein [Ruminococcus sp.]